MVEDAPNISVILPRFMDFCKGSVLVAHNADFDTGFIRHNCEVLGLPYDYTYVDTLGIARSFLEGLKNYKLDTVVEAMGCTLANHHRAVDLQLNVEITVQGGKVLWMMPERQRMFLCVFWNGLRKRISGIWMS